jgi:hypothetical protein
MINRKEHLAISQPTLKDGKDAHERLEAEIDAGLLRDKAIGYFRISVADYHPRVIDTIADLYKSNGWGVEILQWGSFTRELTLAVYW